MTKANDLALLRRFEPVVRFTRGEHFFPMDVEPYIRSCSLWIRPPGQAPERLIPRGELSLKELGDARLARFGTVFYLKLTTPMKVTELAAFNLEQRRAARDSQERFRAGTARLARVGFTSRLVDALFSISLLARGRVPGDMAAAATKIYRMLTDEKEHYTYHGRVVRQDGWLILQYWFFYMFNNWRSAFFGANDHEADWEMVCIYLSETDTHRVIPEWVAYASHDFKGDDLRRRWDDPEVEKVGEHPVVYAGAGSHASYFSAGDYMTEFELPFLTPLIRLSDRIQAFSRKTLRQYVPEDTQTNGNDGIGLFHIPFVDYARGDGMSIGPGQYQEWSDPGLLSPPPDWVTQYRGLWGLYTHDPLSGEDAPAGPMYNRDGTVRQAWYDPLGWAGLDKEPVPVLTFEVLREQRAEVLSRQAELHTRIEEKQRELHGLGIEASAMHNQPHLSKLYQKQQEKVTHLSRELDVDRAQLASEGALLEALEIYEDQLQSGRRAPVRTHIRHAQHPITNEELRFGRLAEIWAAVSIGVMLVGSVSVALFARQYFVQWLVISVSLLVFVESSFRGQITRLVTSVTIALAIVTALILIYEFFWYIVAVFVFVIGIYLLWDNLRELWK